MNNVPSPLMTTEEVCEWIQAGPDTLRRWVASGRFVQPIKVGRRWYYNRAEVAGFFRLQADAAGAELRAIEALQENGLSLDQAVSVMQYHKAHPEVSGADLVAAVFDVVPS